ncbi:hypothetical protein [Actinorugispora endophytica]|nr:hypothetical protein [Actinorugispora endophytica]
MAAPLTPSAVRKTIEFSALHVDAGQKQKRRTPRFGPEMATGPKVSSA